MTKVTNTPDTIDHAAIEDKAKRILRAVIPALSERGLNIESRTGNFFRATQEDVVDEVTGKPIVDMDGRVTKRVRRLVVEVTGDDGDWLPEYTDIADDLAAKRAAAIVKRGNEPTALLGKRDELQAQIEEIEGAIASYRHNYNYACAQVESYALPERPTSERERLADTVREQAQRLERMRAALLAAGLDPDTI